MIFYSSHNDNTNIPVFQKFPMHKIAGVLLLKALLLLHNFYYPIQTSEI